MTSAPLITPPPEPSQRVPVLEDHHVLTEPAESERHFIALLFFYQLMRHADHTRPLSWVVFADDWGRHPSTTQHLVAHLPPTDPITWVGSLGLRAPRPTLRDLRRIGERLSRTTKHTALTGRQPDHIVTPRTLPWHTHRAARTLNRLTLGRALAHVRPGAIALLATPAAVLYADLVRPSATFYLRLDDWPNYRGIDPALVAATEPRLLRDADLVLAPNTHLLAGAARAAVLPQGVDPHRFTAVPLTPPPTRVLGYWGSIAPWLDQDLIAASPAKTRTGPSSSSAVSTPTSRAWRSPISGSAPPSHTPTSPPPPPTGAPPGRRLSKATTSPTRARSSSANTSPPACRPPPPHTPRPPRSRSPSRQAPTPSPPGSTTPHTTPPRHAKRAAPPSPTKAGTAAPQTSARTP